jgi:hypothetical protein
MGVAMVLAMLDRGYESETNRFASSLVSIISDNPATCGCVVFAFSASYNEQFVHTPCGGTEPVELGLRACLGVVIEFHLTTKEVKNGKEN